MSKQADQTPFSGKSEQRNYLLDSEVKSLIDAAKRTGRYGQRDGLMVLMAYRHGLRASELVSLRWDQVMLDKGLIHVERVKNGDDSKQPLSGEEIRALRALKRDQGDSAFVFCTERKGPMEVSGFNKLVKRAGVVAGIDLDVHPHMLRHACGHKLAAAGQDTRAIQGYLGHKNIKNTVIYTNLAENRFRDFAKII
ncbi:MAG: tyrosine-type recombinase/integrase [Cyanobacteria bacterium REEB67]|nr:tyrosine-type recombinase/integrase [Cyanobacteria bacterium REEB67]